MLQRQSSFPNSGGFFPLQSQLYYQNSPTEQFFKSDQQFSKQSRTDDQNPKNQQNIDSTDNNPDRITVELIKSRKKKIKKLKFQNTKNNRKKIKLKRKKKYHDLQKPQKKRKNQNLNKVYNTVALNTLVELGLGLQALQIKQKIYRHDYFLLILMIARTNNKLPQFSEKYHQKIQSKFKKVGQRYMKKNQMSDLRQMIHNSQLCLDLYSAGKQEQAREVLFDHKLKNRNFLVLSKTMVEDIYKNHIHQSNQESYQ